MPTESLLDQLAHLSPWLAFWSIVVATLISEDIATISAGMAAAGGVISPLMAVTSSALGIWLGDMLYYLLGRGFGFAVLQRPWCARILRPEIVDRCRIGFHKRGMRWILTSRFLPGVRTATYFVAGCLGVPAGWFALTTLGAVVIWTPVVVAVSWFAGHSVLEWLEDATWLGWLLALGAFVVAWYVFRVLVAACTWRGRRRLAARWYRCTHWEFWPKPILYAPLLVLVPALVLRHRSLRALAAVNPGLPHGGLLDGSKSTALAAFAAAGPAIARHQRLPIENSAEERSQTLRAFLRRTGLDYPLVLKPDHGTEGSGVCIVPDESVAQSYLQRIQVDCVAQELVAGLEVDIGYVRQPEQPAGQIAWMTQKEFPQVEGDGERSLEDLIYADPRATCWVDAYLAWAGDTANRVPARGEHVVLTGFGPHSRGTIQRDASVLVTPALTAAVDAIARRCPGFHMGRFDVRVPSLADLQNGTNLCVIEWNGPARTPTHVRDPRHGLGFAWRTLLAHWRALFAIGAANCRNGTPAIPLRELLRVWQLQRRGRRSHPRHGQHEARTATGAVAADRLSRPL